MNEQVSLVHAGGVSCWVWVWLSKCVFGRMFWVSLLFCFCIQVAHIVKLHIDIALQVLHFMCTSENLRGCYGFMDVSVCKQANSWPLLRQWDVRYGGGQNRKIILFWIRVLRYKSEILCFDARKTIKKPFFSNSKRKKALAVALSILSWFEMAVFVSWTSLVNV